MSRIRISLGIPVLIVVDLFSNSVSMPWWAYLIVGLAIMTFITVGHSER